MTGLGFDPVWFGVNMVVWLEIGFITPPAGLNFFVIQGLMPGTGTREVTLGTTPYAIDLALWLSSQMMPGRR